MKVAKCLFMGLFLLLHTNCSYELENVEAPDNLIPIDTFTLVLQDVMIVESYYKSQEANVRSEEHTSELQSRPHLVCRLLLEKKKKKKKKKKIKKKKQKNKNKKQTKKK